MIIYIIIFRFKIICYLLLYMTRGLINKYNELSSSNKHITKMLKKLIDKNNFTLINVSQLISNKGSLKKYLVDTYGNIPEYYITFNNIGSHYEIIDELSCILKIICIVDDIHHLKSVRNPRIKVFQKSYYILNTYAYAFNYYKFPNMNNNIFFPHSTRHIVHFNYKPINKILISGTIVERVYPNRYYMSQLAKTDKRLHILNPSDNVVGKKYFKTLGKYIACFVDDSRNYILAKFFEIPASGSLLLAMNTNTKKILESLGFIDGTNYISCSKENIIEKIDYITNPNNINHINNIRLQGYNLIKSKHKWRKRYHDFLKLLDSSDNLPIHHDNDFNSNYKQYF